MTTLLILLTSQLYFCTALLLFASYVYNKQPLLRCFCAAVFTPLWFIPWLCVYIPCLFVLALASSFWKKRGMYEKYILRS